MIFMHILWSVDTAALQHGKSYIKIVEYTQDAKHLVQRLRQLNA